MTVLLRLENLKKDYGPLKVLDIPSWEIHAAESVALLGANATGKTTLLEIIAGLLQQTTGKVEFKGKAISGPCKGIGIVLQNPVMFSTSVRGNVRYGLAGSPLNRKDKDRIVDEALDQVGLSGLANRKAFTLSEGQKQRVAIARALARQPELLLLDEPTASVDSENVARISETLKRLNRDNGLTYIVATHDIELATNAASTNYILENGYPFHRTAGNILHGVAEMEGDASVVLLDNGVRVMVSGKHSGNVDILVPADQVVLSRERIQSSMRNSFKGRITGLIENRGCVKVTVDIGIPLEIIITMGAMRDLGVTIGEEVFTSFKALGVQVIRRDGSGNL